MIAEIEVDMKMFLTASAIAGWAGHKLRNDQSTGKIKSLKITHGNKYLRKILVEAAWSAARTKDSRFIRMYQCYWPEEKANKKHILPFQGNYFFDLEYVIKKKRFSNQNITGEYK